MQAAKKRLEIVLVMWDDGSMILLAVKSAAGRGC
jgi:hypothetical protein